MLNMDEDREMERFQKLANEISREFDYDDDTRDFVKDLVADWAVDPQSHNGIVLQVAASVEFGANLSDYTIGLAKKFNICLSGNSVAQKVLRYAFEYMSKSPITVYRAVDTGNRNALESWTTDREIAEFYVSRNQSGSVIEMETSNYISFRSGFGLECAREIVVINI